MYIMKECLLLSASTVNVFCLVGLSENKAFPNPEREEGPTTASVRRTF